MADAARVSLRGRDAGEHGEGRDDHRAGDGLGEHVSASMVLAALAIVACVLATQRTRAAGAAQPKTNDGGGVPSTVTGT